MSRPLQLLKRELKLQHQQQETGDGGSFAGSWCKLCCSSLLKKFNLLKWINCAGGGGHGRLEQSSQSSIKHQWRFHTYVLADFGIKGALISFSRGMVWVHENPEDNSHVINILDARSHVDHLHFLDALASRSSRPRKGAKGKGVWILNAWSPSEPIIDSLANGRVDVPPVAPEISELDPILLGPNRSWDGDRVISQ